jgi:hypothetical protein
MELVDGPGALSDQILAAFGQQPQHGAGILGRDRPQDW